LVERTAKLHCASMRIELMLRVQVERPLCRRTLETSLWGIGNFRKGYRDLKSKNTLASEYFIKRNSEICLSKF